MFLTPKMQSMFRADFIATGHTIKILLINGYIFHGWKGVSHFQSRSHNRLIRNKCHIIEIHTKKNHIFQPKIMVYAIQRFNSNIHIKRSNQT